jgi:antitoxin (DNA-binding transcriptional repressor) of toxin-antitoxin stability system
MAVSVHEAKTHLSKYLAEVENGLEIVIARGKKPVAMTISKVAGRGSFGFHF